MIEDDELRDMFAAESEEHLQRLEQGFVHLEEVPEDAPALEEVLREAHSLKGSARMLGLTDIEMLAHRLEDTLRAATRGGIRLEPAWMERLYGGLDALRALCVEAVEGTAAAVDIGRAMALIADTGADTPETGAERAADGEKPAEVPEAAAGPPPSPSAPTDVAPQETPTTEQTVPYHIDTIRVTPRRLDALMTHAGELKVIRTRIGRRLKDADQVIAAWEEFGRLFRDAWQALREPQETGAALVMRQSNETLDAGQACLERLGGGLEQLRSGLYDDSARLDSVAVRIEDGIREVRMLPLSTLFDLFPRMVRDLGRELSRQVKLVIEGSDTLADKRVLEDMKDPLMHLIRNAIHHGIEAPAERESAGKPPCAEIRVAGYLTAAHVVIEINDDGRGLDPEQIRQAALKRRLHTTAELAAMTPERLQSLVFLSGLSTQEQITDISGRGVGLDVVRSNVEGLKGRIEVESQPGDGCTVRCILPLTLATTRIILARVAGRLYGIPVESVQTSVRLAPEALFTVEGRATASIDGEPLSVVPLADLLELPIRRLEEPRLLTCVIVWSGERTLGVLVDDVVDEQEIVLKPVGALLNRVRNVGGAGILASGEVCMVLHPQDFIRSLSQGGASAAYIDAAPSGQRRQLVLLAEDSLTTRTQEKRILEGAGYEVVAAVDGADAWARLNERIPDAVVSDIMMPNLDGFGLTARIREQASLADLPVILVTSLASDEDRRKGLEAGANAYITKSAFDQALLLETLKRLVG